MADIHPHTRNPRGRDLWQQFTGRGWWWLLSHHHTTPLGQGSSRSLVGSAAAASAAHSFLASFLMGSRDLPELYASTLKLWQKLQLLLNAATCTSVFFLEPFIITARLQWSLRIGFVSSGCDTADAKCYYQTHRHMQDWQRCLPLGRASKHAPDMFSYKAPTLLHTILAKPVISSQLIQGKVGFQLTAWGLLWVFMWSPAHPDAALFIPSLQTARAIHSLSCVMKGRKERGVLTCLNIIQKQRNSSKARDAFK